MHNIVLIAKRDYLATVRTKAFVVGLVMAPLIFGGGFVGLALMRGNPDLMPKHIAVIAPSLSEANAVIEQLSKQNTKDLFDKATNKQAMPRYNFEAALLDAGHPDQQLLQLSDRVRQKTLLGFLELSPGEKTTSWYSNEGGLNETRRWIAGPINEGLHRLRLQQLGLPPSSMDQVLEPVPIESMALVLKDPVTGKVVPPRAKQAAEGFVVPFVLGMLLMMIVLTIAGPMLSAVAEDKMQRVFAMLLTSATPFDLMAGKITSAIAVALTSAAFYVIAAVFILASLAELGLAPLALLPWFFIYLVAEVTLISAFATAIGTACGSPQDARNLQMVVMLPILVPLFLMLPIVTQPNGPIATAASFFPLFTPLLMLMRQASASGIPGWQPYVGLAGVLVTTVLIAWASSRIFRIAILSQGKTPSFAELVRWSLTVSPARLHWRNEA